MNYKLITLIFVWFLTFSLSACTQNSTTNDKTNNYDDENINAMHIIDDKTEEENKNEVGMANPASVFCEENNWKLEIRNNKWSAWFCIFDDWSECEERSYYDWSCKPWDSITSKDEITYDKKIENIRTNYKEINDNISNYEKIEQDIIDESTEWWQRILYKQTNWDDYLYRKIKETYYWEMWKTTYEFYFDNEWSLSFIFEQRTNYNAPMYVEEFDETQNTITENRYYFYEDNMIKWIDDKKNIVNTKDEKFTKKWTFLIKYSRELTNQRQF